MAICNFRADSFALDAEEGMDMRKVVEVLRCLEEKGLSEKDVDEHLAPFIVYLTNKGLVRRHGSTHRLSAQGKSALCTLERLLKSSSNPSS